MYILSPLYSVTRIFFYTIKYYLLGDYMKYLKKIGFACIYSMSSILILTFLLTIFSFFNIMGEKVISIFKIIIPLLSLLIGGFYIGKKSNKQIVIEGLKFGIIFSILLVLFNLILSNPFKTKYILFYLILIGTSIMGTIVGTSKTIKR